MEAEAIEHRIAAPEQFAATILCCCCGQVGSILWESHGIADGVAETKFVVLSSGFHRETSRRPTGAKIICDYCDSPVAS